MGDLYWCDNCKKSFQESKTPKAVTTLFPTMSFCSRECVEDLTELVRKTVAPSTASTEQAFQEHNKAIRKKLNAHYKQGPIECIDAIQSALTPEEFRGFCKGNALKYLWRERHKGGPEDLQKAGDYLRRLGEGKA